MYSEVKQLEDKIQKLESKLERIQNFLTSNAGEYIISESDLETEIKDILKYNLKVYTSSTVEVE